MTQVMLAIDTSAGSRVAVLVSGEVRSEVYEPDVMKHAEQIGVLLKEALSQAGVSSSQVTNVAVGANAYNFGQIFLAGCMALSARQSTTFRPTTISVHDAGDMDGRVVIRLVHSKYLTDEDCNGVRQ